METEARHRSVWDVYRLLYGPLPETAYERSLALELRQEMTRRLEALAIALGSPQEAD